MASPIPTLSVGAKHCTEPDEAPNRLASPGSGSLFPSLPPFHLALPAQGWILTLTWPGPQWSKVWEAEKWDVKRSLSSWTLLCVWDCTGREGRREGIPQAVNNPDQFAPRPRSRNLFIMLRVFITKSSIALVPTKLQSARQRIFFKHQSLRKKKTIVHVAGLWISEPRSCFL